MKTPARKKRINTRRLTRISFLPSVFTMFNLFVGFIALSHVFKGEFLNASYFIIFAAVFDSLDGAIARLTKTESSFGLQLDSLADSISFGLVTSVFIYTWAFQSLLPQKGLIISFFFLSAGVIRLARFNVYKEVKAYPANVFIGLPIPIASLCVVGSYFAFRGGFDSLLQLYLYAGWIILLSMLMISNIKYRTVKRLNPRYTLIILFGIGIVVAFAIVYRFVMLPLLSVLYLVSPLFFLRGERRKKKEEESGD